MKILFFLLSILFSMHGLCEDIPVELKWTPPKDGLSDGYFVTAISMSCGKARSVDDYKGLSVIFFVDKDCCYIYTIVNKYNNRNSNVKTFGPRIFKDGELVACK